MNGAVGAGKPPGKPGIGFAAAVAGRDVLLMGWSSAGPGALACSWRVGRFLRFRVGPRPTPSTDRVAASLPGILFTTFQNLYLQNI